MISTIEFYCKNDLAAILQGNEKGIIKVDVKEKELLPLILQANPTPDNFNKWIQKRKIPEARIELKETRLAFGTNWQRSNNLQSLTDHYWMKKEKSPAQYNKINFFTNRYSLDVGDAFFKPWDVKGKINSFSPDVTTNGILKKRWKQKKDNTSILIKAGAFDMCQDPMYEVMASKVIEEYGLDTVSYSLTTEGVELCSMCDNFITASTEFVPASYIYFLEERPENVTVYDHLINMSKKLEIKDFDLFLNDMINIDHKLGNTDRHLGNFGCIMDVESRKILGPAPLFDSGSSFADIASLLSSNYTQDKFKPNSLNRGVFFDVEKQIVKNHKQIKDIKKYKDIINDYPFFSEQKKENLIQLLRANKIPDKELLR